MGPPSKILVWGLLTVKVIVQGGLLGVICQNHTYEHPLLDPQHCLKYWRDIIPVSTEEGGDGKLDYLVKK